jgi:hypothetical protein
MLSKGSPFGCHCRGWTWAIGAAAAGLLVGIEAALKVEGNEASSAAHALAFR